MSIRDIASVVGLSPTRIHQVLADSDRYPLEDTVSVLRERGWPHPDDPTVGDGEAAIAADRIGDEASMLLECADALERHLDPDSRIAPVVNLRPASDWPDRDIVVFDPGRIVRILRRVAGDLHELAHARHLTDLTSAETDEHPVRRRRRRYSEPDIERPSGRLSIPQAQRAWERYERAMRQAGLEPPSNPYRHLQPPRHR